MITYVCRATPKHASFARNKTQHWDCNQAAPKVQPIVFVQVTVTVAAPVPKATLPHKGIVVHLGTPNGMHQPFFDGLLSKI